MTQNTESDPIADVRKIPVWAFIVLAIVYPAILLGVRSRCGHSSCSPSFIRPSS